MEIIAELYKNNNKYHIQLSSEEYRKTVKKLNPKIWEQWKQLEGKLISAYKLNENNIADATNKFEEYFSKHIVNMGIPNINQHSSFIDLPESYQGKPIQYEHILNQIPFEKID